MTLEEKLKEALKKDFNQLLCKEFTSDWKVQRLKIALDIDVMDLGYVSDLIKEETVKAQHKAFFESIRAIEKREAQLQAELEEQ